MTNRPRLTKKTYTFIQAEHPSLGRRWFTLTGNTIDQRNDGHASKAAVRRWAKDRELYCGEIVTLRFL